MAVVSFLESLREAYLCSTEECCVIIVRDSLTGLETCDCWVVWRDLDWIGLVLAVKGVALLVYAYASQ